MAYTNEWPSAEEAFSRLQGKSGMQWLLAGPDFVDTEFVREHLEAVGILPESQGDPGQKANNSRIIQGWFRHIPDALNFRGALGKFVAKEDLARFFVSKMSPSGVIDTSDDTDEDEQDSPSRRAGA